MTDQAQLPPAALPRRLIALVYDLLLVLSFIMLSLIVLGLALNGLSADSTGDLSTPAFHPQLVQFVVWVSAATFFCTFWLKGGQTLGMQAWRLKLVNSDGGPVSPRQALLRALGASVSAAFLGAGYWWSLFDRENRYWHDIISGTRLIVLPKK